MKKVGRKNCSKMQISLLFVFVALCVCLANCENGKGTATESQNEGDHHGRVKRDLFGWFGNKNDKKKEEELETLVDPNKPVEDIEGKNRAIEINVEELDRGVDADQEVVRNRVDVRIRDGLNNLRESYRNEESLGPRSDSLSYRSNERSRGQIVQGWMNPHGQCTCDCRLPSSSEEVSYHRNTASMSGNHRESVGKYEPHVNLKPLHVNEIVQDQYGDQFSGYSGQHHSQHGKYNDEFSPMSGSSVLSSSSDHYKIPSIGRDLNSQDAVDQVLNQMHASSINSGIHSQSYGANNEMGQASRYNHKDSLYMSPSDFSKTYSAFGGDSRSQTNVDSESSFEGIATALGLPATDRDSHKVRGQSSRYDDYGLPLPNINRQSKEEYDALESYQNQRHRSTRLGSSNSKGESEGTDLSLPPLPDLSGATHTASNAGRESLVNSAITDSTYSDGYSRTQDPLAYPVLITPQVSPGGDPHVLDKVLHKELHDMGKIGRREHGSTRSHSHSHSPSYSIGNPSVVSRDPLHTRKVHSQGSSDVDDILNDVLSNMHIDNPHARKAVSPDSSDSTSTLQLPSVPSEYTR